MSSSRSSSTSSYSAHSQIRSPLKPITDAECNARPSAGYGQKQSQLKTNCTWNTANDFGARAYKFDEDRAPPRTMHLVPHSKDMCAHHDVLAHHQQFVSRHGQSQPGVDEAWEAARRENRVKSQKAVEALGAPIYDSDMSPYLPPFQPQTPTKNRDAERAGQRRYPTSPPSAINFKLDRASPSRSHTGTTPSLTSTRSNQSVTTVSSNGSLLTPRSSFISPSPSSPLGLGEKYIHRGGSSSYHASEDDGYFVPTVVRLPSDEAMKKL